MKNSMKFFKIAIVSVALLSVSASADAFKGGRILTNSMLKGCPMLLADLAATHTKKEWAQIVKDGKLADTIHSICPKAEFKPIPQDEMKDVLDYLQYYSKDGGALPSC